MSDHADTIRSVLNNGWSNSVGRKEALTALDALLAENQRWETRAWNAERRKDAVEAANQRLREALEQTAASAYARQIAREALAAVREENE
jgi:trimethylamine:corrinoid methyltransferase-like protein